MVDAKSASPSATLVNITHATSGWAEQMSRHTSIPRRTTSWSSRKEDPYRHHTLIPHGPESPIFGDVRRWPCTWIGQQQRVFRRRA
jgi:hypothetical protein